MTDPLTAFTEAVSHAFGTAQQALFESVVQPAMFALGLANHLEVAFDGTMWLLVGLLQIAVLLLLIGPMERWRPAESRDTAAVDRQAVRVDVFYTLVHRLGLFRIALFFTLDPVFDTVFGKLRLLGFDGWQLDQAWPGVTDVAWVSFLLYLLVFDFVDYALHRGQHRWHWWWQLHALHHSQRRMTMWTDNRNHLLDDVIRSTALVLVAQAIGVGPGQFVAIVAITQLVESLSHANLRLSFGKLGERLLVSPRFHRVHHGIGIGHESAGPGSLGGHNFAVLFPVWDLLFGTADFGHRLEPTGIRDQLPGQGRREPGARLAADGGRDYGQGFWAQQWLGVLRLAGRA
jgi:sterol desaturase/sphingolipid hydroxylase (fatty acid hydroxylase superfamily)